MPSWNQGWRVLLLCRRSMPGQTVACTMAWPRSLPCFHHLYCLLRMRDESRFSPITAVQAGGSFQAGCDRSLCWGAHDARGWEAIACISCLFWPGRSTPSERLTTCRNLAPSSSVKLFPKETTGDSISTGSVALGAKATTLCSFALYGIQPQFLAVIDPVGSMKVLDM